MCAEERLSAWNLSPSIGRTTDTPFRFNKIRFTWSSSSFSLFFCDSFPSFIFFCLSSLVWVGGEGTDVPCRWTDGGLESRGVGEVRREREGGRKGGREGGKETVFTRYRSPSRI